MATDYASLERLWESLTDGYKKALLAEQESRKDLAKASRLSAQNPRRQEIEREYRLAYANMLDAKGRASEFLAVHPEFLDRLPSRQ